MARYVGMRETPQQAALQPMSACPEGIGMADLEDLKQFELSREGGFLPAQAPVLEQPREFARWDEIARGLPKLLAAGRARAALAALRVLDPATLPAGGPLRRAMLVLSYFGHACV